MKNPLKKVFSGPDAIIDTQLFIGTQLYKEGRRLYRSEKYDHAIPKLLEAAAIYEHSEARCLLGKIYQTGKGAPRSAPEAIFWNNGADTARSCKNNGYIYLHGLDDVKIDHKEALDWLTRASEKGSGHGTHLLATMYLEGLGVPVDVDRAVNLFEIAAKKGHVPAYSPLGYIYYHGISSAKKDIKKAFDCFERASANHCSYSKCMLGIMYFYGFGVNSDHQKGTDLLLEAANDGQTKSICVVAMMYRSGLGLPLDYQKSMEWYLKAADKNTPDGYAGVGSLFRDGLGVSKDGIKALSYFSKALAIDPKCPNSNIEMGILYWNGSVEIEKNAAKSCIYFEIAATGGAKEAFNYLGDARKYGIGLQKDYELALECYKKGLGCTQGLSELNFGKMYLKGFGVQVDKSIALVWFLEAVEKGCEEALVYVTELQEDGVKIPDNKPNTYDANSLESQLLRERQLRKIAEREAERWRAKATMLKASRDFSKGNSTSVHQAMYIPQLSPLTAINYLKAQHYNISNSVHFSPAHTMN